MVEKQYYNRIKKINNMKDEDFIILLRSKGIAKVQAEAIIKQRRYSIYFDYDQMIEEEFKNGEPEESVNYYKMYLDGITFYMMIF